MYKVHCYIISTELNISLHFIRRKKTQKIINKIKKPSSNPHATATTKQSKAKTKREMRKKKKKKNGFSLFTVFRRLSPFLWQQFLLQHFYYPFYHSSSWKDNP